MLKGKLAAAYAAYSRNLEWASTWYPFQDALDEIEEKLLSTVKTLLNEGLTADETKAVIGNDLFEKVVA